MLWLLKACSHGCMGVLQNFAESKFRAFLCCFCKIPHFYVKKSIAVISYGFQHNLSIKAIFRDNKVQLFANVATKTGLFP